MSQAALMESMERITKQLGETISAMSKLYNLELRDRDNEIALLRKRVEILEMDRAAQSQILCKLPTRREQIRIQCGRQRIYPTVALCAV